MKAAVFALMIAVALGACEEDPVRPPMPLDNVEWVGVPFSGEDIVNVAVLEPEGTPQGVIVAFPWGSGLSELVLSLMDSYWDEAALSAGYVIAGVEAWGPGLESLGSFVAPAVLDFLAARYPTAMSDVIMTGASNGGLGVFFASLAVPERIDGIIAMPGAYQGDPANLASLAGIPTLLMVGELDTPWVTQAQSTLTALEDAGVPATLNIISNQDHVLTLPQQDLMDWINAR